MNDRPSPARPAVEALRERPSADVLIIGGGINGIATFRELALQGIDVALVERGDFVSGASSASSHMVHGGIRYLENGEFRLVKEAVTERNRLLRTAPHYVRPLETTIPIFSTFSGILSAPFRLLVTHGRGKPRERGAALIKMGLTLYDTFSRDGGQVPRHRFLGRRRSLAELPQLNDDLSYTATYYDASMHDPERLALDVLHDGIVAGGDRARAANYLPAVGFSDGAVRLRDEANGGEEFDFTAKLIINTSGPWTDLTNAALGEGTRFMGGTKGSHVVLDHPELLAATGGREIFFEHSDGRIVLIYPLKDRVLVGTTDIEADPAKPVVCTPDEVDYFFDLISHVFPKIEVDRSHIVYTFSGIRPLPRHDDTAPGFVSRDYRIVASERAGVPLLSLVGGKWTTFRALAAHLADDALEVLHQRRSVHTETLPIGGGDDFPRTPAARTIWVASRADGHGRDRVEQLLDRYGTRADEVLAAAPEHEAELAELPGYTASELAHLAGTEQIVHLDDLLLRRTSIAFVGGVTAERIRAAADAIAPVLDWDEDRTAGEVARTIELLRTAHRIDPEKGGAFIGG
ncbi:FAD-dependent oxidoreductase [Leucobacter sp. OLJS4]|uniref:glycerol-3-phosphate dehydrogenase/oxidase n=1 Tax=unclassified Leucobacter TaxID=2621730 RepID=UPI000C18C98B|nr:MULTISPECIES: glycerol-3-phosphate dehydrogenase/oxidase [unclassified Leucobacter]PII82449.1 FAD-dependent oxidoreductase [Leucobacter sp. OLCALW19]PII87371.1 FAD-dependent oxidoreductase [Leucobacter sp. OLTLW20]PII94573.1 FAD-dependent oxidoreductase [Leucobacter sp. OLAS13]PIJ00629.1 FAD-dependent oxidoreductase [Leucobacter sp. OLDS2]PIJ03108.1 FAD-dependent oxidoreductase [Leucobacter sp. OLCS4]